MVHVFDGAWTILSMNDRIGMLNLMDEISDGHQVRFARSRMLPFSTAVFPGVAVQSASVSGEMAAASTLEATGGVLYHALPSDW